MSENRVKKASQKASLNGLSVVSATQDWNMEALKSTLEHITPTELNQLSRQDALLVLTRGCVCDPQKALFLAEALPSCPKPFIASLRMHLGQEISTPLYRGADALVSLASALQNKDDRQAKNSLAAYYKHFNLPAPDILRNNRLRIGGAVKKQKFIHAETLVSIVMTAFNEEQYVERALKSLLNQTWRNIEVIVVDDGSTDATADILEWFQQNSRVTLIFLPKNQGAYAARNAALPYVKGEYCTFQDADDWSHPRRIEEQILPLLCNSHLSATLSKFFRIHVETGFPYAQRIYPFHRLNPSSLMLRTEILKQFGGFDANTKVGADSEFIDRIKTLKGEKSIYILQAPLSLGAYRKGSLTTDASLGIDDKGRSTYREQYSKNYQKKHLTMRYVLGDKKTKKAKNALTPKPLIKETIYFIGFSPWKTYVYNWFPNSEIYFLKKNIRAWEFKLFYSRKLLRTVGARVHIWGYKAPNHIRAFCDTHNIPVYYMEDGFIRSIELGAKKQPPASLTIDSLAPYYDATQPTDLENLLQHYDFAADLRLMQRAEKVMKKFIESNLSKYNHTKPVEIANTYGKKNQRRVLVLGQVEDDDSIRYGHRGNISNQTLIKLAYAENSDAHILYKPHPDVLHGLRENRSHPENLTSICQIITEDVPFAQAIEAIDHVYTITSLAGFEALIRGIPVTTLGCPFYAGWGATDTRQPCSRRTRILSPLEIFAGAYILYPIYIDLENGKRCEIEDVMRNLLLKM